MQCGNASHCSQAVESQTPLARVLQPTHAPWRAAQACPPCPLPASTNHQSRHPHRCLPSPSPTKQQAGSCTDTFSIAQTWKTRPRFGRASPWPGRHTTVGAAACLSPACASSSRRPTSLPQPPTTLHSAFTCTRAWLRKTALPCAALRCCLQVCALHVHTRCLFVVDFLVECIVAVQNSRSSALRCCTAIHARCSACIKTPPQ